MGWEVGMMGKDGRRPGGRITSCDSHRLWDRDRGRPGGQMNLCGSYGGE